MVGICLLSQPYIVVGAVVIIGAVVVAVAIKEELDAYELRRHHPEEAGPVTEAEPAPPVPLAERRPKPEGSPSGQDWFPPVPPESLEKERRPECTPRPVPHLGGDALHNQCADTVPQNDFPGTRICSSTGSASTHFSFARVCCGRSRPITSTRTLPTCETSSSRSR
ncbi:DUF6310 domain-containing protein [Myxococcus sp. RHSTA-1-4]|uniref:DUF6310 domain-containing protein n=1 Tax=Myxococcus sp. RHSTA-1-4 TaxID=2874601 RepID=UPI00351CC90C